MKTLFNFLLMLAIALPGVYAQKEDVPASKWTLDLEIGIPITSEPFFDFSEDVSSFQYSSIGTTYRLNRWRALTAHIAYINYMDATQDRAGLLSELFWESPSRTFISHNSHLSLNLGGQILIRMGQGDLFVGGTTGVGLAWGELEVTDLYTTEYYAIGRSLGLYLTANAGYTYWPIKRLGLTLKVNTSASFLHTDDTNVLPFIVTSVNLGGSYRF